MQATDAAQFVTIVGAVLSALILILIAFIAPLITHHIKIAEFRQAWINDQRKDVAEFLEASQSWIEAFEKALKAGGAPPSERKELFDLRRKAVTVYWRIKMRINPDANSYSDRDQKLLDLLRELIKDPHQMTVSTSVSYVAQHWIPAADAAASQAQRIFKDEWEVTKLSLPASLYRRYQMWRMKSDR